MDEPQVLAKEPEVSATKEVKAEAEIDIKAKPPSDKTTLDFKNSSLLKQYVTQPTAPSQSAAGAAPTTPGTTQTVEQIRAKLIKEEEAEVQKMTVEDFEDIADLIMDIFDTVAIFGLRWYAQDDIDSPYQIPVERMKKLKHRLSRLLMRMQAKIPMGFLFFAGLVMAYATPARKAHAHRKEKMARQREAAIKKAKEAQEAAARAKAAGATPTPTTAKAQTYVPKATPAQPTTPIPGTPPPITQTSAPPSKEAVSPTVILDKDGNVIVKRPRGRQPK